MSIDQEQLIAGLIAQRDTLRQKAADLDGAIRALRGNSQIRVAPLAGTYRNLKAWMAVREYLRKTGNNAATLEELVDGVTAGGCKLGMYPKRAIACAVSKGRTMTDRFEITVHDGVKRISLKPEEV